MLGKFVSLFEANRPFGLLGTGTPITSSTTCLTATLAAAAADLRPAAAISAAANGAVARVIAVWIYVSGVQREANRPPAK